MKVVQSLMKHLCKSITFDTLSRSSAQRRPQRHVAGTLVLTVLLLSNIGCSQSPQLPASSGEALAAAPVIPASTRQLVIVVSDDWGASTGRLYLFARSVGMPWQVAGPASAVDLGRNGSAWGLGLHPPQQGQQKQEGDGKAPAGLFRLSSAFGALPTLVTPMPYQQMSRFDYCIDVPTSPLYNQTLDVRQYRPEWTAGSSEPMRRDLMATPDAVYQQGLFIDHNFSDGEARQTGAGSCIFLHQKAANGRKTAGCTALDPAALSALLRWLDPQNAPLYLLLPVAEYRRLQQDWQLPVLAE
ncbi:hypothetical protein [Rheinheimera texasensis]|uniref:L,D-transpeptidase family protein n=1 Tax=Rheinheimera texasensis TaxID=306205 RepID=UPI0032B13597